MKQSGHSSDDVRLLAELREARRHPGLTDCNSPLRSVRRRTTSASASTEFAGLMWSVFEHGFWGREATSPPSRLVWKFGFCATSSRPTENCSPSGEKRSVKRVVQPLRSGAWHRKQQCL